MIRFHKLQLLSIFIGCVFQVVLPKTNQSLFERDPGFKEKFEQTFSLIGMQNTSIAIDTFPDIGNSKNNRLDNINAENLSVLDWQKRIYALLRSIHNTLLKTGNSRAIKNGEI